MSDNSGVSPGFQRLGAKLDDLGMEFKMNYHGKITMTPMEMEHLIEMLQDRSDG